MIGRIILNRETDSLHGAEKGVAYDGKTVLEYGTEEKAKEKYEELVEEYGEGNVIPDIVLSVSSEPDDIISTAACGLGTGFMGLDDEIKKEDEHPNGKSIKVAVLDTGVMSSHLIFGEREFSKDSKNIINEDESFADDHGHGTMVAGIIAESTPESAEIMILKTMRADGGGSVLTFCQGIEYAVEKGADVINCSLEAELRDESICEYFDDALSKAADKGVPVISSTGNDGANMDETIIYPAESPFTIAVGAIRTDNKITTYSNYGTNVDFVAPGDGIKVAHYSADNALAFASGTSFSAPLITSAIALLKHRNNDATPEEIYNQLKNISVDLGDEGKDVYYGWGMPYFQASEDNVPDNDISYKDISLSYYATTYSGKAKRPSVHIEGLTEGTDYSVAYKKNKNAGTARVLIKGIGSCTGQKSVSFRILRKSIKPKIVLKKTRSKKKLAIAVYDSKRKIDEANYSVACAMTTKKGTCRIVVKMKKNYKGRRTKTVSVGKGRSRVRLYLP